MTHRAAEPYQSGPQTLGPANCCCKEHRPSFAKSSQFPGGWGSPHLLGPWQPRKVASHLGSPGTTVQSSNKRETELPDGWQGILYAQTGSFHLGPCEGP